MRQNLSKTLQYVFCLLGMLLWMLAGYLHVFVNAAGINGSLTMVCQTKDGVMLEGMEWELYLVGHRTADGSTYELIEDYARYPISFEDTSAAGLLETADTLESYVIFNEPYDEGVTDANGNLKFSGLEEGLYLVYGDNVQIGDTVYFFASFLVEISSADEGTVHRTAYPKYVSMNASGAQSGHKVSKIWQNDETEPENRSAYVTVEIYRDKQLYRTVRLDESNDWTYEWEIDGIYKWNVVEVDIPAGYDVTYRTDATEFLIVNTFTDSSSITDTVPTTDSLETETVPTTTGTDSVVTETMASTETDMTEPTTEMTDGTDETTQTTPNTTAATSTTTSTTTTTTTTTTEKIPQTGQLWWPVPLLAIAGLISICIGVKLYVKE